MLNYYDWCYFVYFFVKLMDDRPLKIFCFVFILYDYLLINDMVQNFKRLSMLTFQVHRSVKNIKGVKLNHSKLYRKKRGFVSFTEIRCALFHVILQFAWFIIYIICVKVTVYDDIITIVSAYSLFAYFYGLRSE